MDGRDGCGGREESRGACGAHAVCGGLEGCGGRGACEDPVWRATHTIRGTRTRLHDETLVDDDPGSADFPDRPEQGDESAHDSDFPPLFELDDDESDSD